MRALCGYRTHHLLHGRQALYQYSYPGATFRIIHTIEITDRRIAVASYYWSFYCIFPITFRALLAFFIPGIHFVSMRVVNAFVLSNGETFSSSPLTDSFFSSVFSTMPSTSDPGTVLPKKRSSSNNNNRLVGDLSKKLVRMSGGRARGGKSLFFIYLGNPSSSDGRKLLHRRRQRSK